MHDSGCRVPRTHLLRGWVNKGAVALEKRTPAEKRSSLDAFCPTGTLLYLLKAGVITVDP